MRSFKFWQNFCMQKDANIRPWKTKVRVWLKEEKTKYVKSLFTITYINGITIQLYRIDTNVNLKANAIFTKKSVTPRKLQLSSSFFKQELHDKITAITFSYRLTFIDKNQNPKDKLQDRVVWPKQILGTYFCIMFSKSI